MILYSMLELELIRKNKGCSEDQYDTLFPVYTKNDLSILYDATSAKIKHQNIERNQTSPAPVSNKVLNDKIAEDTFLEVCKEKSEGTAELNSEAYDLKNEDWSRDSRIEDFYKKHFWYDLAKAFGGHCCRCSEGMCELEFDHFWLPKAEGGNFAMRHQEGYYVNNCIPLCRSCKASKGSNSYVDFFNAKEIEYMVTINHSLTASLNSKMEGFVED